MVCSVSVSKQGTWSDYVTVTPWGDLTSFYPLLAQLWLPGDDEEDDKEEEEGKEGKEGDEEAEVHDLHMNHCFSCADSWF